MRPNYKATAKPGAWKSGPHLWEVSLLSPWDYHLWKPARSCCVACGGKDPIRSLQIPWDPSSSHLLGLDTLQCVEGHRRSSGHHFQVLKLAESDPKYPCFLLTGFFLCQILKLKRESELQTRYEPPKLSSSPSSAVRPWRR